MFSLTTAWAYWPVVTIHDRLLAHVVPSPTWVPAQPVAVPASRVLAAAGRVQDLSDEVARQEVQHPVQFVTADQVDR